MDGMYKKFLSINHSPQQKEGHFYYCLDYIVKDMLNKFASSILVFNLQAMYKKRYVLKKNKRTTAYKQRN